MIGKLSLFGILVLALNANGGIKDLIKSDSSKSEVVKVEDSNTVYSFADLGNKVEVEKVNEPVIEKKSEVVVKPRKSRHRERVVYSGQCNATTKKGTRCRRNANYGTRYCWQHQP